MHTRISGVADHLARDDRHALEITRSIFENLGPRRPPDLRPDSTPEEPAYDPEELSLWLATAEQDDATDASADVRVELEREPVPAAAAAYDDVSTAPIELSVAPSLVAADVDEEVEAERASRAAFQRWTSSSSE